MNIVQLRGYPLDDDIHEVGRLLERHCECPIFHNKNMFIEDNEIFILQRSQKGTKEGSPFPTNPNI